MDTAELDTRDAGLAAAVDHAVRKRWVTLAAVIETQLARPWDELEPRMQAALLVGAAQLLLLDRLPDHAVINEAVQWTKKNVRVKAGGMVNAVLRKIARLRVERKPLPAVLTRDVMPLHDGNAWLLAEQLFDANPIKRLAQQTSHSDALIAQWMKSHGERTTTSLALHSLFEAPIIVHKLGSSRDDLGADVGSEDGSAQVLNAHEQPGFHIFTGDRTQLTQFLRDHSAAVVQDPASAAPVRALAALKPKPELVIDACAGKGTKTRQLAALFPAARIIAADTDADRLLILRQTFADHSNVEVTEYRRLMEFAGQADLVVLDVPCSNTGVLARRVEAKYRFTPGTLEKIVNIQRQIIADSILLLREHGRILYCTCSIEAAENEQQMQWLRKWHPFEQASGGSTVPRGRPGDSPGHYCDGGFFALLPRSGQPRGRANVAQRRAGQSRDR